MEYVMENVMENVLPKWTVIVLNGMLIDIWVGSNYD